MLSRIMNCEYDYDFGIEAFHPLRGKIRAGVEGDSISSALDLKTRREKILCPAVRVRGSFAD